MTIGYIDTRTLAALISRNVPLSNGTKIEVRVTSYYEITVDDDLIASYDLNRNPTFAEIQRDLGRYGSDQIATIRDSYDCVESDIDYYLDCAHLPHYYHYQAGIRFERSDAEADRANANTHRYVNPDEVLPACE